MELFPPRPKVVLTVNDGTLRIEGRVGCIHENSHYPNVNVTNVTSIEFQDGIDRILCNAFAGFNTLESISIGGNVAVIEKHAFAGCNTLKSISIDGDVGVIEKHAFESSQCRMFRVRGDVQTIKGEAFMVCQYLEKVTVDKHVTRIETRAFYGGSLETFHAKHVSQLQTHAFTYCAKLTDFSVATIGHVMLGGAFLHASTHIQVTPTDNTERVMTGEVTPAPAIAKARPSNA